MFSGVLRLFWRAVFYDKTITPPQLDEEYFIECEEIFPQVYTYVRAHYDDFAALLDFQAG